MQIFIIGTRLESKTIDYKVKNVKKGDSSGKYSITFQRKGEMQMPLDFTVINTFGEKFSYHIPNNYFIKNTNATILPMWHGWGKIYPEHKAEIQINGKLKNVIIDTTYRLADINLLNNNKKFPLKTRFDWQVINTTDRKNYELFWRLDLWYNSIDGLKAGIHFDGDYFNLKHGLEFTAWYNTLLFREKQTSVDYVKRDLFNFNFSYKNPLFNPDYKLSWFTNARILDGLYLSKLGIGKSLSDKTNASLYFKTMWRPEKHHLDYLLYPDQWNYDKWNNTLNANLVHSYINPKSNGYINLNLRSSTFGSDYNYSTFNTELLHKIYLKKFVLKNRLFGSISTGNEIALESKLFLAQSNPEEMMENKFTRSRGFFPTDWLGYGKDLNHFQYGGGLNLRGYSGYLAPKNIDTGQVYTYSGTTGASVNFELEFDRWINIKPKFISKYFSLNTYLFFDGGIINYNKINEKLKFADFRMDAGLGTALTIKSWGALQKVKPFTVRFDMPFYVSHIPFEEKDNLKFRWILGVGRAF